MKRINLALLLFLLAGLGSLQADQTTSAVQQTLKDQGFYYGNVTGKKTSDTTAAIRRYQIRNGLQITGEIDAETLRSLGIGSGAARSTARSQPAPVQEQPAHEEEAPTQSAEISPPQDPSNDYSTPNSPNDAYRRDPDRGPGPGPTRSRPTGSGVFAGTPYEIAPLDVQRHVVVGAQTLLARYGYYRSGIDGQFGPGTQEGIRGFQARTGLAPNGRLNMETLAALGLLPGQHTRGFRGPQRVWGGRPVYQGELLPGR